MSANVGNESGKYSYFEFLVYPESAPDDWVKVLKRSHGCFAISPLHEPDEELSKPHYHVIYKHGNPITLMCALRLLQPLSVAANGYIEPCYRPKGAQRYLIHLDDPEKQQFEGGRGEIQLLNGFPLDLKRELSGEELREIRRQIFDFIERFELQEYSDLLEHIIEEDEWFDYACNHTILFNTYLQSRRHRNIREDG